ncbi:MAG: tetratricopeptide repeat protein [Kiritimatiellae bacterium]|nr:tetratricopeptide repeat protein [Kiritimatiellia bacterium]
MASEQTEQQSEQFQRRQQNFFNKGFAAFERGNLDMAVDLLYQCVEMSPGFLRARKFLRAAAIQRYRKRNLSPFSAQLAELAAFPQYLGAMLALKRGQGDKALLACEKLLQRLPLSTRFTCLTAEAAMAAGQIDAALMTLETAVEQMPEDASLLMHLGTAYQRHEDWRKARDTFNALVNLRPHDGVAMKLLKDAEARLSMAGTWDKVGDSEGKEGFRSLIKDQQAAATLDKQAKSVVSSDDAETLIAEQKARIAAEPKNLNYYRALARLYQQQKRHDEAVKTIEAARAINPTDPDLDRALSAAKTLAFDARIEAADAAGDRAAAEAIAAERSQFVFDDLVQRVERYPNDLRLRFELGTQYLQYESYDDAIQQLQLAQRSPKERNEALYALARCFRAKGQRDMAVMQLETALEQLPVMDDLRKQVVYELGELQEEAGNLEKAFAYYREVYGADIAFRDISAKMERMYKLRKS